MDPDAADLFGADTFGDEETIDEDGVPLSEVMSRAGNKLSYVYDFGGWSELVMAANDPGHEDHEESRGQFGPERGEVTDAIAFDPRNADALLEDLR